jgi:hypothetical protein
MTKKLYISDLKKYLHDKSKDQLTNEIVGIFKLFPIVQDYYTSKLSPNNNQDIFEKYQKIIKKQFYPDRGFPKLKYSVANKAIRDYQKISNDSHNIADLMLSYVEYGIMCTNSYGDIDEQFYNAMEGMFEKCLKHIKKHHLQDAFRSRCQEAVKSCNDIGWGFGDTMADIYGDYFN